VIEMPRERGAQRRTPQAIRAATFSQRRRGWDEDEVREFLSAMADQIQEADAERASLRAEAERLRSDVERLRSEQRERQNEPSEINDRAVALFSQAQQVADRLVEEAVQHARDLMTAARTQQREILQQAHEAAETAAREVAGQGTRSEPGAARGAAGTAADRLGGYSTPVPEIEYVRTFAHVAQVQLRSVLDALTEQVDRLGQVPHFPEEPDLPRETEVSWQLEARPHTQSTEHR
jgi:DivIVA domain-containing protein